jgi:predicted nucleotidyltransferase
MTLPIDYKQSIKQHVNGYLPGARVVLFGSRSRGDNHQYSDVDLLVIADQEFTPKEKITMESMICKELVKTFHLPFDVLLYSQSEVARKKEERSLILYHALKDGMEL